MLKNAVEIKYFTAGNFWWYEGGMDDANRDTNCVDIEVDYGAGPVLFRFKKVADGYSPDEVKELVNNTLSDELASQVNNDPWLYRHFEEYDGVWYYYFGTAQFNKWNEPTLSVSWDNLKNFEVVSSVENGLTVRFTATFIRNIETEPDPCEADAFVTLTNIGGKWKVSAYDVPEANVQTGDDGALFAAVAVLILAACVMIAWKKQMFVRFKKTL